MAQSTMPKYIRRSLLITLACLLITMNSVGAVSDPETCDPVSEMDVVFLFDVTGTVSDEECAAYLTFIAETMDAIKEEESSTTGYPEVRFAAAGGFDKESMIVLHLDDGYWHNSFGVFIKWCFAKETKDFIRYEEKEQKRFRNESLVTKESLGGIFGDLM
eukprot:911512_1